jgi:hypothetical protein
VPKNEDLQIVSIAGRFSIHATRSARAAFSVSEADWFGVALLLASQFPLERFVENRGKHGVNFGGGFGLK